MVAKVPVPKFQKPREYIQVEPGATAGATIGKDVYSEDGKTLWVPPTPATPQSPNSTRVFWINILDVPPNVKALAETVSAGLYVVTGAGTSATRSIAAVPGETTVADGDGIAGNPTIGLADVTPTAGGSILRVAFDSKGRRSQEDTATTDNLPEGANLYFTDERAQDAVGTILADTATVSLTYNDGVPSIYADVTPAGISHNALASLQGGAPAEYYHLTLAQHTGLIPWSSVTPASKQNALTNSTSNKISGTQVQRAALTGDVTAAANANATTIANDAVSNAKLANMATQTIKGRMTAGTGDPEDLTGAQARAVIGAEPAIAAGTTAQFWRGDKVWSDTLVGNLAIKTGTVTSSVTTTSVGGIVASFASTDAYSSGYVGTISNHALGIYTNNILRATVGNNGHVGIGKAPGANILEIESGINTVLLVHTTGGIDGMLASSDVLGGLYIGTGTAHSVGYYSNNSLRMRITSDGNVEAGADNAYTMGSASNRWSVVYAATGSINTSDAREKTAVSPMTGAEIRAASSLAKLIGTYRWLDAIKAKGGAARMHVGATVQSVMSAMEAEGLDPFRYGFICYDEWGYEPSVFDEDGNETKAEREAGSRYSFRMDELTLFIARGMEERIAALEKAVASYNPSAPAG